MRLRNLAFLFLVLGAGTVFVGCPQTTTDPTNGPDSASPDNEDVTATGSPDGPPPKVNVGSTDGDDPQSPVTAPLMSVGQPIDPNEPDVKNLTITGSMHGAIQVHSTIESVAWSPDGQTILTSAGNEIQLWSAATGKRLRTFGAGHTAEFLPDGKQIVVAEQKALSLYNVATGKRAKQIRLPEISRYNLDHDVLHLSADGTRLLLEDQSKLLLFDLAKGTGKVLEIAEHVGTVETAGLSPDGKTIAAVTRRGVEVYLLDADTLKVKTKTEPAQKAIQSLAFSQDGKTLAATSGDYSNDLLGFWNVADGKAISQRPDSGKGKLIYSPGGNMVALLNGDVHVHNVNGESLSPSINTRFGGYFDAAFSPDGRHLAAISRGANSQGDSYLVIFDLRPAATPIETEVDDDSVVFPLAGGKEFLSVVRAGGVAKFTPASEPEPLGDDNITLNNRSFLSIYKQVSVSPDGTWLIAADDVLTWYSIADAKVIRTIDGKFASAVISPDGDRVIAHHTLDNTLLEFDAATGKELREWEWPHDVQGLAIDPSRKWLAIGSDGGQTFLIDYESLEIKHQTLTNEGAVSKLAFSPNGKWLATLGGLTDPAVSIWEVGAAEPQFIELYKPQAASRRGLAFSPDSKLLMVGDGNGRLHLVDVEAKTKLLELPALSGNMEFFQPASDGTGVLIASNRGAASYWSFADLSVTPAKNASEILRDPIPTISLKTVVFDGGAFPKIRNSNAVSVSADESLLATEGSRQNIDIYDLKEIQQISSNGDSARRHFTKFETPSKQYIAHRIVVPDDYLVVDIALSQTGDRLFVRCNDGKLALWDTATGKELQVWESSLHNTEIAASPGTPILAIGNSDAKGVRLFDISKGTELAKIPFEEYLLSVAIDDAGKRLAVAGSNSLTIFELPAGKNLKTFDSEFGYGSLAFSHDGKRLAGATDSNVHLLDVDSGEILWKNSIATEGYGRVAFSPNDQWVLANNRPGFFFDAKTGELLRSLNQFSDFRISNDGKYLLRGQLFSIDDIFNDELQQKLAPFVSASGEVYRAGDSLILRLGVDGRITRELLGRVNEIGVPIQLDLTFSDLFGDDELKLLENAENIHGILLPLTYDITERGIDSLTTLPNLQEINMSSAPGEWVALSPKFPALRVLAFEETNSTDGHFFTKGYAAIANCKHLEDLEINLVSGETAKALVEAMPALKQLRNVDIDHGDLTAEQIALIASLPNLQRCGIACSDLDDKASALAKLKSVTELSLNSYDFTDAGLSHLSELTQLEGLDLHLTDTAESAKSLAKLKNLRWCWVDDSATEEFIKDLKDAAPNVHVFK